MPSLPPPSNSLSSTHPPSLTHVNATQANPASPALPASTAFPGPRGPPVLVAPRVQTGQGGCLGVTEHPGHPGSPAPRDRKVLQGHPARRARRVRMGKGMGIIIGVDGRVWVHGYC
jgi:hypothetical protein